MTFGLPSGYSRVNGQYRGKSVSVEVRCLRLEDGERNWKFEVGCSTLRLVIQSFQDLKVYQQSYDLALVINRAIIRLPLTEKHILVDQMRRASKSIPANIAEGYAKRLSEKEFRRYILSAIGSCNEMVVHISFAKDLGFWKPEFCEDLLKKYDVLGKQLTKLMQNWKSYPTSKI